MTSQTDTAITHPPAIHVEAKALTVKQPWAWAIIRGLKTVENRSRPTKHRGRLFIHAGKGWAQEGMYALRTIPRTPFGFQLFPLDEWDTEAEATRGYVIGTVDVIDCHHADECWTGSEDKSGNVHEEHCSPWAMEGNYHWVLANARPLACPFPETGKLGIWRLSSPSTVKEA